MYQYRNHYEIGHKAERYEHIEKTISMYRYINHYQIVASKEEGHPGVCVWGGGGGGYRAMSMLQIQPVQFC